MSDSKPTEPPKTLRETLLEVLRKWEREYDHLGEDYDAPTVLGNCIVELRNAVLNVPEFSPEGVFIVDDFVSPHDGAFPVKCINADGYEELTLGTTYMAEDGPPGEDTFLYVSGDCEKWERYFRERFELLDGTSWEEHDRQIAETTRKMEEARKQRLVEMENKKREREAAERASLEEKLKPMFEKANDDIDIPF